MKPRTALEKEATWLSRHHLLSPSMEQIEDADKKLFTSKAFYTKKNGYACMECGEHFRIAGYEDLTRMVTCPHCGKSLRPEATRKKKELIFQSYMLVQSINHCNKEFVVHRLFSVAKRIEVGKKAQLTFETIAEYFTTETGQVCLGLPITQNGSWSFSKEISVKKRIKEYTGYYGTSYDSYRFFPSYICHESVGDTLIRNGFTGDYDGYLPQELTRLLLCVPDFEKLYKIGGKKIANYAEAKILNQYKIANRHHYEIKDISLWVDVIKMLRSLGMDDRNPKHICPDNLKQWHDCLYKQYRKMEQKKEEKRRLEENLRRIEREKEICEEYVKRIARFMQLNIQDEVISIIPIPTVQAVAEEGTAMHHCVFAMGYYKRPEVLLLSARDRFGNRVETIEVNLNSYSVVQSRGRCNSNTEHHDRILELLQNNMAQIREFNTQKSNIKAA